MSKRNKDKGRLAPFVPVLKETMETPAWRAMSPAARLVYISLKQRFSTNFKNNGKLYLSTRKAAEEVGLSKSLAALAFREIEHYGFGVVTVGAHLGVEGKGKAPHWRLTEIGYMAEPPTKEFLSWNRVLFERPKTKPCPYVRDSVSKRVDTSVQASGQLPAEVSRRVGHRAEPECPGVVDITSLTTGVARAGSDLEGDVSRSDVAEIDAAVEPPAHAPMGHNTGPPLDQDDLTIPAFLRRTSLH